MLPFHTLLSHSLFYGAILSALLSALIVATLYFRPMIWINDAPAEVRAAAPPLSAADRRVKRVVGLVFMAILLGVPVLSLSALRDLSGGTPAFIEAALSTFIVFMTFNAVDLVLLDWLLVEWLRPGFLTFPGMQGAVSFGGYAHHFRGFLIGTALSAVAAAVMGGVAALVWG